MGQAQFSCYETFGILTVGVGRVGVLRLHVSRALRITLRSGVGSKLKCPFFVAHDMSSF